MELGAAVFSVIVACIPLLHEDINRLLGRLLSWREADADDTDVSDRRLRGASPQNDVDLSWVGKSPISTDMSVWMPS